MLESMAQPLLKAFLSPVAIGLKYEWTGFDNSCRDHLGVDGKTLLRAWGRSSCLEWLEDIGAVLATVELDEEVSAAMAMAEQGFRAMLGSA